APRGGEFPGSSTAVHHLETGFRGRVALIIGARAPPRRQFGRPVFMSWRWVLGQSEEEDDEPNCSLSGLFSPRARSGGVGTRIRTGQSAGRGWRCGPPSGGR